MKECEKHRFGKWQILVVPILANPGHEIKEYQSCVECGKSRYRKAFRFIDPDEVNP